MYLWGIIKEIKMVGRKSRVGIIARKELKDSLNSKIVIGIMMLFLLLVSVSIFQGVQEFKKQEKSFQEQEAKKMNANQEEQMYFNDYQKPKITQVFFQMIDFIAVFGSILAIILGYGAIAEEKKNGTLKLLLSYPLYRDNIINGKFLGRFLVLLILFVVTIVFALSWIVISGLEFGLIDLGIIALFTGISLLFLVGFMALGLLLALIFNETNSALLTSIMIWFIFAFLVTSFALMIGNVLVPIDESKYFSSDFTVYEGEGEDVQADNLYNEYTKLINERTRVETIVGLVSPNNNYIKLASSIMNPSMGEGSIISEKVVQTTFEDALKNNIFSIIYLIIFGVFTSITSYIVFLRKDVR